jgi:hypothetical protein
MDTALVNVVLVYSLLLLAGIFIAVIRGIIQSQRENRRGYLNSSSMV